MIFLLLIGGGWAFAQAPAASPAPLPAPPPPANPDDVKQVNVSVKIVEFQTSKGSETGLSAYFKQRQRTNALGQVLTNLGYVRAADVTFPTNTTSAITVFLDQIRLPEDDMEMVLQALVHQDRAFILSQPKAMVTVGSPIPTTIQTTNRIPYQNTVVVGATAVQTTAFRDTGVSLTVQAPAIQDDDGNPATTDDTYIQLLVSAAVNEQGQQITVALDDRVATGGIFGAATNAIKVPEFVSRSVATSVWVRHGQVLLLGGLYRNTKNKNLATLPWLTQGENSVLGVVDKVLPTKFLGTPLSSTLGNSTSQFSRRELVFLIKAELWRPAYTVVKELTPVGTGGDEPAKKKGTLSGVIQEISDIPKGLIEGKRDGSEKTDVQSNLGGGQ
ncbi:MAG TPA: hypothetical protein PKO36_00535 [Candidatus Hydrogenedentes bacterium]|nr:hypothetical protein [Candidatus Hydrogenedentota bacterium]HRT19652.1 hypothetical protein [Candidatus Hydrogenedentota bacterium]